jgi:hypothetical protein
MTKHMMMLVLALAMLACAPPRGEKIKCYAWTSGPGEMTDQELSARFADYKRKGIDGLMYNGGQDAAVYQRVGQLAKAAGAGVSCLDTYDGASPQAGTAERSLGGERPGRIGPG